MEEKKEKKLTIYEYEEKHTTLANEKKASTFLKLIITAIGILIISALFSLFKDVYEINKYVGYAVGAMCIVVFILLFIVPVAKIMNKPKFEVNATEYSARKMQRHNDKVRTALADKIIDAHLNTEGLAWYSSEHVESLVKARQDKDKKALKEALNLTYKTDVKKVGRDIITKASVKSGLYSAVSQQSTTDSLIVTAVNLQMIKDIVYLYGFRPSETKLLKIFAKILSSSFASYGIGNVKFGNTVTSLLPFAKTIPILGSAISVLVDSSVQGLTNATLTAIIGTNTIKYLMKEYNLQNVLDSVELTPSQEEFNDTCEIIKKELSLNKVKTA